MKRIFSVITVLMLCLSFASCSVDVSSFIEDDSIIPQTMDRDAFSLLLSELPLAVVSTEYVKKDIQVDSATPEMLRVVLKNNSEYDIKNAVISFVAWDANKLPVKIKSAEDYTDGAYVRQVSFDDINLVPGATFGEDYGYKIDENCHIASFEAIVLSFETFENQVWKNPYYDEWCDLYEGTKITESMSVTVKIEESAISEISDITTSASTTDTSDTDVSSNSESVG